MPIFFIWWVSITIALSSTMGWRAPLRSDGE